MTQSIVTVVDTHIPPEREAALLDGYRRMLAEDKPDALLHTELLRGQSGAWRIQTTWRDLASLQALRQAGKPPAALALLNALGAAHTHTWFTVEAGLSAVAAPET